ncbi:hypothetical protein NTE_03490 [Candidatus Nitrososphaera evergladensis SR1]|uniref:Uncharacterized protein n=2 Tax=Nitrososphaera TaxID=497726 RepID=A0A075MWL5_9ARCH|nr:hypothetical protein NTE_03490 [Candidatus Nitrososphaera evergladensis SR1]
MTAKSSRAIKEERVRIHPTFKDHLLEQLMTAFYDGRGHTDKIKGTFDLGDAFLMRISNFRTGELEVINNLCNFKVSKISSVPLILS